MGTVTKLRYWKYYDTSLHSHFTHKSGSKREKANAASSENMQVWSEKYFKKRGESKLCACCNNICLHQYFLTFVDEIHQKLLTEIQCTISLCMYNISNYCYTNILHHIMFKHFISMYITSVYLHCVQFISFHIIYLKYISNVYE